MKTFKLNSGDLFPAIGLGTWKAEPGEVGQAVKTAVAAGYRHIDCAAVYGNEAEIGTALAELFLDGVVAREDLWITSKLWNNCHAPEQVQPAFEKTRTDLQLDYLDLYLIHWPVAFRREINYPEKVDDMIPLTEIPLAVTWQAMEPLVDQGLCRNLGVANFNSPKLEALIQGARHKPQVNQVELHPYLQQTQLLEYCQRHGIVLTGYAPLGSAGRPEHLRVADEPIVLQDPVILAIAAKHQLEPAQVLLHWGIARGTSVIPKSVNPSRIRQNLAAVDCSLSPEAIQKINQLDRQRRYFMGQFWSFPEKGYTLTSLWDE